MRDVSAKANSLRTAKAEAILRVTPSTIELIRTGNAPKGDPLGVARVAAIQGAKNTPQIIPYCHSVPLDYVGVDFELTDDRIVVTIEAKAIYKTGVEMEALTAAAVAALNLYDLLKPVDEGMEILSVRLLEKVGGKSDYVSSDTFEFAVIVVSDRVSKGEAEDISGAKLADLLKGHGGMGRLSAIVPDETADIANVVSRACAQDVDLIVLTGGTGLGPRDRTPEAVLPMLDARATGLEAQLLAYSRDRLPTAMLGRPFAGKIGRTLVVGLPGSPGAVQDAVDAMFPFVKHAFHILDGGGHGEVEVRRSHP